MLKLILLLVAIGMAADQPDTMTVHTWMASAWGTATAAGIAPSPVPPPGNANDWKKIWDAWGGAAWDTAYHRMELMGGGHMDYSGNEIQSFSPATGWARLTTPTDSSKINHSTSIYSTGYYSVGSGADSATPDYHAPRARHTYNLMHSIAGKLYLVDCVGCYPSVDDIVTSDRYDFSLNQWDTLGIAYDPGSPAMTASGSRSLTGVDSLGRLWWVTGGDNAGVSYYSNGHWTTLGSYWDGLSTPTYATCASVPQQNRMYCFGNGLHGYINFDTTGINTYDTSGPSATLFNYATTGATSIESSAGPGITYDPQDTLILGWNGTDSVFALNLNTAVWTAYPKGNAVAPTSANANGTFGRWQYMPEWNAVVLTNRADDSVYYWKPSAGSGTGIGGGGGSTGTHMLLTGAGK